MQGRRSVGVLEGAGGRGREGLPTDFIGLVCTSNVNCFENAVVLASLASN